ncbi:MAG: hypothetical protein LBG60_15965 [Bifidobacteriaceae bacterium]|nr:hypothetical protein [Bifidobacteriaceae bacterium]
MVDTIDQVGTEPLVLQSALKREGVTERDLLHAYALQLGYLVDERHADGPMILYVGPSASGAVLLEVGVLGRPWPGLVVIAHGMKARPWVLKKIGLG